MDTALAACDLDTRIADAFRDGAISGDVADLIKETEAGEAIAGEAAEQSRTRALDPVLAPAGVAAARREMEDAAFRRDRLHTAVARLQERLRDLQAQEEQTRRQAAYDRLQAERDALAGELARLYPSFAEQLSELLGRLQANNREIEYINANALPAGASRLLEAELVARGLTWFAHNLGVQVPSIVRSTRLPAFERNDHQPFAWPPAR